MSRKLYSTPEAAKLIGVAVRTIHRWMSDDKIKPQGPSYPRGDGVVLFWTEADIAKGRKVKADQKPGPKSKLKG
jgi:hypothetical protein